MVSRPAHYEYDRNGNRVSYKGRGIAHSARYDDQDRLLQYGGATYSHTASGFLSEKTINGQKTRYGYDGMGNLRAVSLPDNTQIKYLIDNANRRIGTKVNGVLVQGFLYDEDHITPVAELDGSGKVVSRFIYASRDNVPDYMVKGGVTYRVISDQLGSPRLVVNTATVQIIQRIGYDEFGNVILDTNPGFQPFGFAGGLYDRNTGLVRFGARDYDPEVGRWMANEPSLAI